MNKKLVLKTLAACFVLIACLPPYPPKHLVFHSWDNFLIVLVKIALLSVGASFYVKSNSSKDNLELYVCPNCEKSYRLIDFDNNTCEECECGLVPLEGFYNSHPSPSTSNSEDR